MPVSNIAQTSSAENCISPQLFECLVFSFETNIMYEFLKGLNFKAEILGCPSAFVISTVKMELASSPCLASDSSSLREFLPSFNHLHFFKDIFL